MTLGWQGINHHDRVLNTIPCGSELARDGGRSGGIDVGCKTAIASKLAPTGESR
jgi:hypothetical protein